MTSLTTNIDRNTPGALHLQLRWAAPVALLLVSLTLLPGFGSLVEYWLDIHDYSYGVLVGLICLAWLWRWRSAFVSSGSAPSVSMLVMLTATLLAWYCLWQGNSELGEQLLIPLALWFSIAAMLGFSKALRLALPIGYLYFAIPAWDQLLPYLQRIAVFGARASMQLTGVSVSVTGNRITIPEGTFEVLYACSGLRFLVVSTALAFLLGVIDRMRKLQFAILVACTAVLAIIANWLRIFIVMYAGHLTKMSHYFVSDNHKGLGNAIFAVLLVCIYAVAQSLQRRKSISGPPRLRFDEQLTQSSGLSRIWVVQTIGGVLLVFLCLTVRASLGHVANYSVPQLKPVPFASGKFEGPFPPTSQWFPSFDFAGDVKRISYTAHEQATPNAMRRIDVYLNVYGVQHQGKELVYFRNDLHAPGVWEKVGSFDISNEIAAIFGNQLAFEEYVNEDGERWLFGQTYVVGGVRTTNGLFAQAFYGGSTMLRPVPAGVVAIATRCARDCVFSTATLNTFWREMGAGLTAAIPTQMN